MMRKQIQTAKGQAEQAKQPAPMRRLEGKEMRQVAGGPLGFPDMGPKKT
jgi:hypothetical protein